MFSFRLASCFVFSFWVFGLFACTAFFVCTSMYLLTLVLGVVCAKQAESEESSSFPPFSLHQSLQTEKQRSKDSLRADTIRLSSS